MIEIIPNQGQYYIKRGSKRLGAFDLLQLQQQELTPNTLIWFQGQQGWKRLKDIPELTPVYNSLPPQANNRTVNILWGACVVATLTLIGLVYYLHFYLPAKAKELKPITTEDLYKKYSKSVALIKHAFLYKIHIGNDDYYFKDYDPETGNISGFSSNLDSLKQDPNIIWGTGFFIDDKGSMLTCNHVVNVSPSKNDQEKILATLREKASSSLIELYKGRDNLMQRLENLNFVLSNLYQSMSQYEYLQKSALKDDCMNAINELDSKIALWQHFTNIVYADQNLVSKTSLQFGIFLNDTASENLNDYIKCEVIKRSKDENIDLAVIQTLSKVLPHKSIVPLNLDRIKQADTMTVRLTEQVRMIGYNYGINIANTSSGIKSQVTEGAISQNSDAHKLLYTVPALPGSSGAPIFDQFGRVVSVNFQGVRASQSFNYGIQPRKIKEFLGK